MAGLVPAIHVLLILQPGKTWMPGTGPGMTRVADGSSHGTGFAKSFHRGGRECESGMMMDYRSVPQTPFVVPAKAGTHNHCRQLSHQSRRTASKKMRAAAYRSLLSQGRRSG